MAAKRSVSEMTYGETGGMAMAACGAGESVGGSASARRHLPPQHVART